MIRMPSIIVSRRFIFIAVTIFILGSIIASYTIIERKSEEFMLLAVLGKDMRLADYYNSSDKSISVNETLQWYISVYNRMDSSEYISIRVKIANSTDIIIPYIFEERYLIKHNSTYTLPFKWSIRSLEYDSNYKIIKKVMINDKDIPISVRSIEGKDLRMIIELFRYDITKDSFEPVRYNKEVLNQIWFNLV